MFFAALKEHALEEGGVGRATMRSFARAARDATAFAAPRNRRRAAWYVGLWAWLAVCVAASGRRAPPAAPAAGSAPPDPVAVLPPVDPSGFASVYGRLRATPVALAMEDDDRYLAGIVARVRATMRAFNYSCLCATHVGVPVQIAVVGNDTVLMNPRRGPTGARVSSALETSAFYPKRRPKRVTRFVPVTVFTRDREVPHVFAGRAEAHCVLHLLDQMLDGRSPYDAADA